MVSQSIPTLETFFFRLHTKTQSISVHYIEPSDFWPALKTEVDFDPSTKNKSSKIPTLQPKVNFDPSYKKQVNFDTINEMNSILIPTLSSSRFLCPDTKTQLISILTLKTSHFRQLDKNQIDVEVIFDNLHNNQILLILNCNQVKFDPPHWNQFNPNYPQKTQVNFLLTQKTSEFRPAFKTQVNFNYPHNNEINFIYTVKSS